jgi:hypothetical protein
MQEVHEQGVGREETGADAMDTFLRQTRRGERIELVGADGWQVVCMAVGISLDSLPRATDADAAPALHPAKQLSLPRPNSSRSAKTDLWIKAHNHAQIVDKA